MATKTTCTSISRSVLVVVGARVGMPRHALRKAAVLAPEIPIPYPKLLVYCPGAGSW